MTLPLYACCLLDAPRSQRSVHVCEPPDLGTNNLGDCGTDHGHSAVLLVWERVDTGLMQASLLSSMILGPTASWSRNLNLCEQYYHKLLEFFFLDLSSQCRSSSLAGGPPLKEAPGYLRTIEEGMPWRGPRGTPLLVAHSGMLLRLAGCWPQAPRARASKG